MRNHCRLSVGLATMVEKDTTRTAPERRCNACARGPRRSTLKGHDRLMHIMPGDTDSPPPPGGAD